jgi:type IV fimbrial biogenesis protein FimT
LPRAGPGLKFYPVPIPSRQAGVTAVEAVVVLTIGALFAVAAVPSFYETVARSRLESATRRLASDLVNARSAGSTA